MIGRADGYRIEISRLETFEGFSFPLPIATAFSAETSFRIPPGVLEDDGEYSAVVFAIAQPDAPVLDTPWRPALPAAETPAMTGVFSP